MKKAKYDAIDDYYLNFVRFGAENRESLYSQTTRFLINMAAPADGEQILDVCCGEGQLARDLIQSGATVTGIDISKVNISAANKSNPQGSTTSFLVDDAQTLSKMNDRYFDLVVCKMAIMDVPNIDKMFKSVKRALKNGGRFVTALLHPCFETPFTVPFQPVEKNANGDFKHHRIQRYFEEGHWNSGGSGVRGRVGAHHRKISTLINSMMSAGIQLVRLEEPQFLIGTSDSLDYQWSQHIPRILFIEGKATA